MIKHELNVPLVSTFHTLDRVKAEASPEEVEADTRAGAEPKRRHPSSSAPTRCWPRARSKPNRSWGCTVPTRLASASWPPVSTMPSSARAFARRLDGRWDFGAEGPLLLFVGRIQPLKGADVAGATLLRGWTPDHPGRPAPVVVGGPGADPMARWRWDRLADLVVDLGLDEPGQLGPRRGPTSCCRPTTGPPTSASSPAAPNRSAWWRWRLRPAAPRWWPPTWAGSRPWSTTAAPVPGGDPTPEWFRRGPVRSWPSRC